MTSMLWITVISVFGLVAGAPLDQQPAPCEVCHMLIGELQDYLTTDQSKDSINTYVQDICTKLPSDEKDACLQFTESYAGLFFSKLNDDLDQYNMKKATTFQRHLFYVNPESFCNNLPEICPKQPEDDVQTSRLQDDAGCEICQLLVTYLDQLLKDNATLGTVNRTLYEICDAAPQSFKSTCYVLVPGIEAMLQSGIDPKTACTLTNFCQNATISNACGMCQFAILTNKGMINNEILDTTCTRLCDGAAEKDKETMNELARLFKTDIKPCEGKGSECEEVGCAACKVLIQGLDFVVGANFTVGTINGTMTDICNRMAGQSTQDACLKTVPKIVELMETGLPAEETCKVIGLCKADIAIEGDSGKRKLTGNKMKHIGINDKGIQIKKLGETPGCIVCKGVGQALSAILRDNITIFSFNSTLQDICVNLPADSLKESCFGAIPNIIKIMKTGLNVTDICLKTKLCISKGDVSTPVKLRKVRSVDSIESQFSLKCDICEFVINELDKELEDNSTDKTINSTVYGACAKLQGAFRDVCLESAPQIITTIEQGINTNEICAQIKICNSTMPYNQEITQVSQKNQRKDKTNSKLECDICIYIVTEVDKRIGENKSIAVINQTVYEICDKLTGTLATLCKVAAPLIVKQISQGGDPRTVCVEVKLCTQSETYGQVKKIEVEGDLQCDVCKYLITEAEKRLTFNSTIEKINETLINICSHLFGNLKKICYAATPQIVTALQGGEDPGKVCTKVNFCPSTTVLKGITIQEQIAQQVSLSSKAHSIECNLCKFAVKEIDAALLKGKTGNATVYEMCNQLTGALLDLCLNYAPEIVRVLETGINPDTACELIKLCVPTDLLLTVENPTTEKLKGIECDLCELAIKEIDTILQRNASKSDINSTVYGICNALTGVLQATCLQFAPQVVDVLSNGVDPKTACAFIKVCDSKEIAFSVQKPTEEKLKGIECDLCELAIKEIDSLLQKNASQKEINSTVYGICNALSGTLQDMCLQFAPKIVDVLMNGVDPKTACDFIKVCDATDRPIALAKPIHAIDILCDVCEFAVQEVDKYLADNATDVLINGTVYNACNFLSGTLQALCYSLAPNLVQTIEGGADPLLACQLITLCKNDTDGFLAVDETSEENQNVNQVDLPCDVCEFAIQEMDKYLADDASAPVINSTVYTVCSALPGSFLQNACYGVAPNFVAAIEGGVDPNATCRMFMLCNPRENLLRLLPTEEDNQNVNQVDLPCDVCEFAIQEMDKYLADDASAPVINSTVYTVCSALPGSFLQNACYGVAPNFVAAIEGGVDPDATCRTFMLCNRRDLTLRFESKSQLISQSMSRVNDGECELCEYAIKELDMVLSNNASADKINATIYEVCSLLPASVKLVCLSIAPQVVKAVEAGFDPETACTAIGVCTNKTTDVIVPHENLLDCNTCQGGLNEIWYTVHLDYSKVEGLLFNLCERLPSEYQSMCAVMVEQDDGVIFKKFIQSYSPVAMCEMAGCTDFKVETESNKVLNFKKKQDF